MVQIINACERGDCQLVAPTIAIAEVLRCDSGNPLTKDETDKINRFFDNDYWHFRPVDRFMGEKAQDLARHFRIKPLDAIHAASYMASRADVLYTFDGCGARRGLLDVDGQEFEGRVFNVKHPSEFASGTLWAGAWEPASGPFERVSEEDEEDEEVDQVE